MIISAKNAVHAVIFWSRVIFPASCFAPTFRLRVAVSKAVNALHDWVYIKFHFKRHEKKFYIFRDYFALKSERNRFGVATSQIATCLRFRRRAAMTFLIAAVHVMISSTEISFATPRIMPLHVTNEAGIVAVSPWTSKMLLSRKWLAWSGCLKPTCWGLFLTL